MVQFPIVCIEPFQNGNLSKVDRYSRLPLIWHLRDFSDAELSGYNQRDRQSDVVEL